jgi:hypothetical protein
MVQKSPGEEELRQLAIVALIPAQNQKHLGRRNKGSGG